MEVELAHLEAADRDRRLVQQKPDEHKLHLG